MTVDEQPAARLCVGPLSRFARDAGAVSNEPEVGLAAQAAKGPRD